MAVLRRVLVILQANSWKMLHWLDPAVSTWEHQVLGLNFSPGFGGKEIYSFSLLIWDGR